MWRERSGGRGGPTKTSEEACLMPDATRSSDIASPILINLLYWCLWGCDHTGEGWLRLFLLTSRSNERGGDLI